MSRIRRWATAALGVTLAACAARPVPTVAIAEPPRAEPLPQTAQGKPELASEAPEKHASGEEEETDELPLAPDGEGDGATSTRGWLGVELEPVSPSEAGVRVIRVVPRSPAEAAGIVPGDVILRLDATTVSAPADVVAVVSERTAGTRLGVSLKRGSADHLAAVTLGAYPDGDKIYRMSFVDRPAPAFDSVATAKGSVAPTLLAQRGQVVILEFWAPWCVACRALIPHMNRWHAQYAARGVKVIGMTLESVPRALSAANELGMDYSILSDSTGRTSQAYQARAIPAVFVIDRRGNVRDVMVGYDGQRLAKLDTLVEKLVAEP